METIIKKQADGYSVEFDGKKLVVNGKEISIHGLVEFNKLSDFMKKKYSSVLSQNKIETLCLFGDYEFVAIRDIDKACKRIKEIQELLKYKPEDMGAGWCEKCQSYCFGDCEAN